MKTYNFNDESFKNTDTYKQFINTNESVGYLKIRAYAASGALPISNLKILVSKVIDNNIIIFYEGLTDSSGIIEKITLPAPRQNSDDLTIPTSITYDIKATYSGDNITTYKVNIYDNIYAIQNISIVPTMNVMGGN